MRVEVQGKQIARSKAAAGGIRRVRKCGQACAKEKLRASRGDIVHAATFGVVLPERENRQIDRPAIFQPIALNRLLALRGFLCSIKAVPARYIQVPEFSLL